MRSATHLSLCFDLDGTLVDTAPDLVRVLNLVLAEEGLGETDYEAAAKAVGFGAKRLILEGCARAEHRISEARLTELWELFLKLYADDIAQLSKPYPGVTDTLRRLKMMGHKLSICTNKPGYLARPLIEKLGMMRLFDRVIGSGDGFAHKPNPAHIFAAAGHRYPSKIVMIGDSTPDVMAAQNAGVPVFIMSYGYSDISLAGLKADQILYRFSELPDAIIRQNRQGRYI